MDDPNQGQGGAGGAVEPTAPVVTPEPNGDPLDDIKDPVARAEAKKFRAIARRQDGKDDTPPAPTPEKFASKDDLAILVTAQAKELVSADIRERWDDLIKIPLGGFNPLDARSIAQNMEARMKLLPKEGTPPNPAAPLTASVVTQGTGGTQAQPKQLNVPGSKTPKEWYPKKS